jgi:hypothetical protein
MGSGIIPVSMDLITTHIGKTTKENCAKGIIGKYPPPIK